MQKTEGKKLGWRVPVIGGVILLLAAALILGAIFLPQAKQKREMKKALNAFLTADAAYALVTDPRYKTGDLLGNDGKEVRLDDAQLSAAREAVRQVAFSKGGGYFLFTAKRGDAVEALYRLLSGFLTEK